MRRRKKLESKYHHKMHKNSVRVSGKRVPSQMCAVRFYWTGRKYIPLEADTSEQELATYRLAIRCHARHATPMQAMAELTLGGLISSWMRWLYAQQNGHSRGN